MTQIDINFKKDWIIGLMICCPFGTELDNCPAKEIRTLPLTDRLELLKSIDEKQIDQIIAHHRDCLHKREKYN